MEKYANFLKYFNNGNIEILDEQPIQRLNKAENEFPNEPIYIPYKNK